MALTTALYALTLAAGAYAHGHVRLVIAGGQEYVGGLPHGAPADAVGWAAGNQDNGFVEPNSFGSPDIICHKGATPASNSVTVAAGSSITLQWDTWPESHKVLYPKRCPLLGLGKLTHAQGPVIDYLASCNGDCSSVDKGSLSFAKIAESGLVSGSNPGTWAADELVANGFSWTVSIPASVAPGNYVLRHEIIALHSGGQPNGAQAYPQCINLEITGSGSSVPSGTSGTSLYTASDPGILFNLYEAFTSYDIPGPALWSA